MVAEPFTLLGIGGAALLGIVGNRTDGAFCQAGRRLRATLFAGIREARNHDVARAIRRAQLVAVRQCLWEYGKLDHGRWYEPRRLRARREILRLHGWVLRRLVADRGLEQELAGLEGPSPEEWSARARKIETRIERVFTEPEPHDGPAAERQEELRRLAEDWTLDEILPLVRAEADRKRLRRLLVDGTGASSERFPGWWRLFRAAMAEEVKGNAAVSRILDRQGIATLLELQTDLTSAVSALQQGLEDISEALAATLHELRVATDELERSTRRIEGILDRFSTEFDRVLPTLERIEDAVERGFQETQRAHSALQAGIESLAAETRKWHDRPLPPLAEAVWDFLLAAGGTPVVSHAELVPNEDRSTDVLLRGEHGVVSLYCCVEGGATTVHVDRLRQRLPSSGASRVRLISALPIPDGLARYAAAADGAAIELQSYRQLVFEALRLDAYAESLDGLARERVDDRWFVPPRFSANLDPALADPALRTIFDDLRGYLADWLASSELAHVALLGEYGSGKTAFAARWARERLADFGRRPTDPLVLLLRAADAPAAESFDAILAEFRERHGTRLGEPAVFDALRRAGRLLLVFDGLDELAIGRPGGPRSALSLFAGVGAESRMLLTSRTNFFRALAEEVGAMSVVRLPAGLPPFRVVRLEPFDTAQVRAYITGRVPPDQAERIQRVLFDTYGLPDLATRPVLLDMMLSTWDRIEEERSRNPKRVVQVGDLYRHYTERWFDGTASGRHGVLTREQRLKLMVSIAVWMTSEGVQEMDVADLGHRVSEGLGEAFGRIDEIQREVRLQNFLVRNAQDRYHFAHRSFQEYFLAQKVAWEIEAGEPELLAKAPLQPEIVGFTTAHAVDLEKAWALVATTQQEKGAAVLNGNLLSILRAHGEDFSGRDLSGLVAENARLRGARFVGTRLTGARLHGCDLRDADFSGAALADATLTGLILGVRSPSKCVRFLPRAPELLASDGGTTVHRLFLEDGERRERVHSHEDSVTCIATDRDGALVASGGFDGRVRVTNLRTEPPKSQSAAAHGAIVYGVAIHRSSRYVASSDAAGRVKIWDLEADREAGDWLEHRATVYTVDWSPAGDVLATASFDKTVGLWRFSTEGALRLRNRPLLLRDHHDLVNGVRFSPCGEYVAAASNNGTVRIWQTDDGRLVQTLEGQQDDGDIEWAVAFAPGGELLAAAGSDGVIRVWDWRAQRLHASWPAHESEIWTLDFDATGQRLASGSLDGWVAVWPVDGGEPLRRWHFQPSPHGLRMDGADLTGVQGLSGLQRRVLLQLGARA